MLKEMLADKSHRKSQMTVHKNLMRLNDKLNNDNTAKDM